MYVYWFDRIFYCFLFFKSKIKEKQIKLSQINKIHKSEVIESERNKSQLASYEFDTQSKVTQNENDMTITENSSSSRPVKSILFRPLAATSADNPINEETFIEATNNRKRKSVRFNVQTEFLNENKPNGEPSGKGHFLVEEMLKKNESNPNDKNIVFIEKYKAKQASIIDEASSLGSNSNETFIFDDESDTTLDLTSKPSSFEFDSILFPKASKYIDCYDEMSTLVEEKDESMSSSGEVKKESKKDKKIISNDSLPVSETSYLTMFSMELHVNTRQNMHPNPDEDSIGFIIYTVYDQKPTNKCLFNENEFESHMIIYDQKKRSMATCRYLGLESNHCLAKRFKSIKYAYKEEEIFDMFMLAIKKYDPDLLIGNMHHLRLDN